ncbi:hypothetical protein A6P39_005420 [Streptomyces sp. FXJ1.172]|uniref:hypothetical protein n=1 Tax=Streptomyces sp. FXJ1.172 TaxID=710705 RepID=UPI0007CF9E02|nr:hypothetical protein [Streptomyces sp. FXJ1.172]WEO93503.1 hypothetical protein A6P39_005420 [Streptomyces sp. FXJ1.172]
MRKISTAAAAAAVIAGISMMAAGPATAQAAQGLHHGGGCRTHNLNIDILGEVGVLNGLAGNLINGEGSPGGQFTDMGTDCDR